jgi:glycosyltransferase involved in cell wall biosynthesis
MKAKHRAFSIFDPQFDPGAQPPSIAPLTQSENRPLWSVMIPTFNCARYLKQTLESVLAQDLGPELMQIEVVDDFSTQDDPEQVVREVGKGRVAFYRKEKNSGATANFNTCIERSQGEWVHILHGDDWVAPEFYESVRKAIQHYPQVDAVSTRGLIVTAEGEVALLSDRLEDWEKANGSVLSLLGHNPIMTPTVVVRRRFYETHGGFDTRLVHVADWEMWARIARLSHLLSLNQVLAYYRAFDGNDTGRLAQTGENLIDCLRFGAMLTEQCPDFEETPFLRRVALIAYNQKKKFAALGNTKAYAANQRISCQLGWKNRVIVEWPRVIAAFLRSRGVS